MKLYILILLLCCYFALNTSALSFGIDVSRWNDIRNWSQIKKDPLGIKFVIIKATEGANHRDPQFNRNWNNARNNGMRVGAYHFFIPGVSFAKQAQNFISVLRNNNFNPTTDFAVLDVEKPGSVNKTQYSDQVFGFLDLIERTLGCSPIVYTARYFWNPNIDSNRHNFAKYRLWVANYRVNSPKLPNGWTSWFMWQYDDKGQVKGIQGNVDLNKMQT